MWNVKQMDTISGSSDYILEDRAHAQQAKFGLILITTILHAMPYT